MSQRKPDDQRQGRVPPLYPTTVLVWDGERRGPDLDPRKEWCEETKEWWEWLRHSAQAMLMQESDWLIMKIAAFHHNQMFTPKLVMDRDGEIIKVPCTPGEMKNLSSEFRSVTEPYGLTRQSRIKYGINVVTPEDVETEATQTLMRNAPVVIDYRKRLTGDDS